MADQPVSAISHSSEDVSNGAAVKLSVKGLTHHFGDFKALAHDWQLRGEEPNDHSDAAYDQQVIDRLPAIDGRVQPIVERAAQLAPRLNPYGGRLRSALERVQAGDHAWLLKPLIDSYHTVWFELHEELISLAGLSREAEAASGRAE